MVKNRAKKNIVLVSVLKDKRDFDILFAKNWYRIPTKSAPELQFNYLAFYQPAIFGRQGKRIQYYARVLNYQTSKRKDLLPNESNHPRACDYYFRVRLDKIKKLARPIRNIIPRRISFGFTTLNHLLRAKNILQLYGIAPTEQIIGNALKRAGIKAIAQYYVSCGKKPRSRACGTLRAPLEAKLLTGRGRRYCLDFAVFCKKGAIAIECDNKKAHSSKLQRERDKVKNAILARCGWLVIRLPEQDIVFDLEGCIARVQKAVRKLGGLAHVKYFYVST